MPVRVWAVSGACAETLRGSRVPLRDARRGAGAPARRPPRPRRGAQPQAPGPQPPSAQAHTAQATGPLPHLIYRFLSSNHEHTENSAINNVPLVYLHWGANGAPNTLMNIGW